MSHSGVRAARFAISVIVCIVAWGNVGCQPNPDQPGGTTPPVLANAAVVGQAVKGQAQALTISCSVSDDDGLILIVTADLSELGESLVLLKRGEDGVTWSWSGVVTPPQPGTFSIRIIATTRSGQELEAVALCEVGLPPANQPPRISDAAVTGTLQLGAAGQVTITCTVADSDGTVASVTADLAALGGQVVALRANGSAWSWTGAVTPAASGNRQIILLATDDDGAIASVTQTIHVTEPPPANQPPRISDAAASGDLQQGAAGELTISCTAVDDDGTVASVTANLAALGGEAVALQAVGSEWSWTGRLTPPSSGTMHIVLLATDDDGAIASVTQTIHVTEPPPANQPPRISDAAASGDLQQGAAGELTISCTAVDDDGTVASVTANLATLGGEVVALQPEGGVWTWRGSVTAGAAGPRTIALIAVDDDGASASAQVSVTVANPPLPPLVIGDFEVQGSLQVGVTTTLILRCSVTGSTGTVTGVTLDLSAVASGMDNLPLTHLSGDYWTWSGEVTPDQQWAWRPIYLHAQDDAGAEGTLETDVFVTAAMYIHDAAVIGSLRVGEPGEVTITCKVADVRAEVVSVTADLGNFGIETPQHLVEDAEGTWSWTGTLTAPAEGDRGVLLSALDAINDWSEAIVEIPVE